MKKPFKKFLVLGLFAPVFLACSTDDILEDSLFLNSQGLIAEGEAIAAEDLTGTWVMHSMTSDIAIDLNNDQESSADILAETDCFKDTFFSFDQDGVITTGQAKLDFDTDDNEFVCGYGEYQAAYELDGNELVVEIEVNGSKIIQSKTIALSSDVSGEYLHVSLEDYETAEFVNDPGTTAASDIERIEIVYKKY